MVMDSDSFCIDQYDCIGFDMDHTVVQYNLPEVFKLIYSAVVQHLVKEKNYSESVLHIDNFTRFEDFSLRGIIYEFKRGNFVKLDSDGIILSCTHGLTSMSEDEIKEEYGKEKKWPLFHELKKKMHHGDGYALMENFFLMPVTGILGQLVEDADKKNTTRLDDYTYLWKDSVEGLSGNFIYTAFKGENGLFFPSIKKDVAKYLKKTPNKVISWIKKLRESGKTTMLITDSYSDFATHLMNYAVGEHWKELFDFIIVYANKPNFFKPEFKERQFLSINEKLEISSETNALDLHTLYGRGNGYLLEENLKKQTGKDNVKVVYFGDSMKSDIYPPKKYLEWDTVAIIEEMEAEELLHDKNNTEEAPTNKKPKIVELDEDKLLIASTQWGSFFTHPILSESGDKEVITETFWQCLLRNYSKLTIPLLDYIADLPLDTKLPCFSSRQLGFYPFIPKALKYHNKE